jgi:hypothetical protein
LEPLVPGLMPKRGKLTTLPGESVVDRSQDYPA